MKRNLKKDFFRVALEDAKGDSGKVWKAVEKAYNTVTRKNPKSYLMVRKIHNVMLKH